MSLPCGHSYLARRFASGRSGSLSDMHTRTTTRTNHNSSRRSRSRHLSRSLPLSLSRCVSCLFAGKTRARRSMLCGHDLRVSVINTTLLALHTPLECDQPTSVFLYVDRCATSPSPSPSLLVPWNCSCYVALSSCKKTTQNNRASLS